MNNQAPYTRIPKSTAPKDHFNDIFSGVLQSNFTLWDCYKFWWHNCHEKSTIHGQLLIGAFQSDRYIRAQHTLIGTHVCLWTKLNNKYVYRQSHGWSNYGSVVKWAECLHVWAVDFFYLMLDGSVGERAFSQLPSWWLRLPVSNPGLFNENSLSPFDYKTLHCARI